MESSPPAPPSASPMLSVADWDARIDALKQRVLAGDWSAALLRETADAQESREAAVEAEAEAARDAAHPFRVIGNTVRVPFGAGTRRAMICDVNGDGTLDVIFEASSGVPAAEATVPADTATRLERFETEDARAGEKDDEAPTLPPRTTPCRALSPRLVVTLASQLYHAVVCDRASAIAAVAARYAVDKRARRPPPRRGKGWTRTKQSTREQ